MKFRLWKANIFFTLLLPLILFADEPSEALLEQRKIFLQAEHCLKKNDEASYEKLAQKIRSYPLYPYLVFDHLKRKIQRGHVLLTEIQAFSQSFPDFPYNTVLRNQWLMMEAKNKHWQSFVEGFVPNDNVALNCHYHYAKYHLTGNPLSLKPTKDLWLVGYSQPDACDPLFKAWTNEGELTEKLLWQRFELALEEKSFSLADHLLKQLPKKDHPLAQQWKKLVKNPYLLLTQKFQETQHMTNTQMLTQTVKLLAKLEPEKTLAWWNKQKNHYPFTTLQSASIERDIGIYLSHQKSAYARTWLANLDDHALTQTLLEWRIRLALHEGDWPEVLMRIHRLPEEIQSENSWQYWRARALEALGKKTDAVTIYQSLSQYRNYYGFLSSLRLKQPFSLHHKTIPVGSELIAKVSKLPALQRFYELEALGKTAVARVEWFRAVDKMNEQEILACAKIAHQLQLYDIAILTLSKADFKDDISIRFPLVHKNAIIENAHLYNLDPAWVFGVARQESAFFTEAVSPAGARGLLQLLPSTAKKLAKLHHIPYPSEHSLHEPLTNLKIGSVYLKDLKQSMKNHIILATASYNAGPTRTQKWLPKEVEEADIWIENIPYKETREYVKNVLTFTSIYRERLGYPFALGLMMKPVPSRK